MGYYKDAKTDEWRENGIGMGWCRDCGAKIRCCKCSENDCRASACSADLSNEQIKLAENLGSFLWESSTLRHGLFTPPEFSRLVRGRIKQYFYEQNVDVDTPASAGCVPRLVRLFGFLFGACCWIGFPLILLGLPTVYLFGMSGGNWFTWSFYALSWVVALLWWFLCFRWGPTREFIDTYADRPNDGKPRNY